MPTVGWVLDPCFEEHDTGPGHPERAERLRAVRERLQASPLCRRVTGCEVEPVEEPMLFRVHDRDHVARVDAACAAGARLIDSMDTTICRDSARIARLAAGSAVALCRRVARGELQRGFAALRPPGHHAERDLAMGFCLFNNVAVAARELQATEKVGRVLIVDWDVHHGNGTQHLFEEDPSVFFFSVHQSPLYPGTGLAEEIGRGRGKGTTLNCPLPPGTGDEAWLATLRDRLLPAADAFAPEFVLVSAGFDAHRGDPLAGLAVSTGAFAEATRLVLGIAERHAGGRFVSLLEGGYDPAALADSVVTHLEVLTDWP